MKKIGIVPPPGNRKVPFLMATPNEPILPPNFGGHHVVILGAGASRAVCPNGDKNGHILPLMADIVDVVGLAGLFEEYGVMCGNADFETLYSRLVTGGKQPELVARLERAISDYFVGLELPDHPTLYDHLVLSLRPKDLIASFNWDPLLWQALCRNGGRLGPEILPRVLYLHGNVAIGYCRRHKPITLSHPGERCKRCRSPLEPSRLLYPVTQKDYNQDPCIAASWREFVQYLKGALILTIFGYRAPDTDVEAVSRMKQARGDTNSDDLVLDQVEIIDIRDDAELHRNWKPFICRDHYDMRHDFNQSLAALYPRRSCEAFWEAIMDAKIVEHHPMPIAVEWHELYAWLVPLLDQERAYKESRRKG